MYCIKCGAKLPEEALFCSKCGQKVMERATEVQNETAAELVEGEAVGTAEEEAVGTAEEEAVSAAAGEAVSTAAEEAVSTAAGEDVVEEEIAAAEEVAEEPFIWEGTGAASDEGGYVDEFFDEEWPEKEKFDLAALLDKLNFGELWRKGVASGRLPLILGAVVILLLLCLFLLIRGVGAGSEDQMALSNSGNNDAVFADSEASEDVRTQIDELLTAGATLLAETDFAGALQNYEQAKALYAQSDEVYLFGADVYLKQNNYNMALQVLNEGYQVTGSDILAKRVEYVKENIFLIGVKSEDGETNFYRQYNQAANLTREHRYNELYELIGWEESEYDALGNRIRNVVYNRSGVQESHSSFEYDSKGVLMTKTDYNAKGTVIATHSYIYDGNGRQIECIDYNAAGAVTWSTKSEYDGEGRKIRDTGYDAKGRAKSWVDTQYDAGGSILKMSRYDERGNVVEWNQREYDANGNEIRFTAYDAGNTATYWTQSEYDGGGNLVKKTRYNADGSVFGTSEFDGAGMKVIERIEGAQASYFHAYYYFGDILCESNIQPIDEDIKMLQPLGYRGLGNSAAGYAGTLYKDSTYSVIGQTDHFYKLADGWYLDKAYEGTAYITVE